jgi:uncharacterized protein (DUF169 family)
VDKNKIRELALSLEKSTGLASMPVGIKFVFDKINDGYKAEKLSGYRYCQALMQARHGKHVTLDAAGIACPAAAAAFGYKPLPEALKSGKGLVGFGITVDEETGKRMFEEMTVLEQGKLKDLYLFPLEQGGRIESNTAVLQATCVDTALVPFVNQKFNMSFGCYGCRDATDIGPNETVIGFPFKDFEKINGYAARLAEKAVANSRAKNAYALLRKKAAEKTVKEDPFQAE